jgi:hypothetical protein
MNGAAARRVDDEDVLGQRDRDQVDVDADKLLGGDCSPGLPKTRAIVETDSGRAGRTSSRSRRA